MNFAGRDLLVLSDKIASSPQQLEQEVRSLHHLLYEVENTTTFCQANEVVNLNNYRIIHKPHHIEKALREMEYKPFIFLCNKN